LDWGPKGKGTENETVMNSKNPVYNKPSFRWLSAPRPSLLVNLDFQVTKKHKREKLEHQQERKKLRIRYMDIKKRRKKGTQKRMLSNAERTPNAEG